jgi:K+-transporting ATPase ATPase A chain
MTAIGWLQILLYAALILAITKPLGIYLHRVLEGDRPPLPRVFGPIERVTLRMCGVDASAQQTWTRYTAALLSFSALGVLVTYAIQRLQHTLPLNPQGFAAVGPELAFNTAASFTTNTNWQSYAGESTMSYLTQMAGLAWHNFTSAAAGIAVAVALARGLTRRPGADGSKTIGNFWVDLVRSTLYVLLPISIVAALVLASQGVIQNFSAYREVTTLEGSKQLIAMGPVASQEAIKELGTNGGGFFNANSAHPFENPTPFTNFFEMLLIFAIPAGLTSNVRTNGGTRAQVGDLQRDGLPLLAGVTTAYWAESHSNPALAGLPIDPAWQHGRRRSASGSPRPRSSRPSPPTPPAAP